MTGDEMKNGEDPEPDICMLHKVNGLDEWCASEECVFWRFIDAQDAHISSRIGCGLQYHELVGGLSDREAEWLLAMKKRLQSASPKEGRARILFRRRESKE